MKYAKMLGIAVAAVAAVLAFIGAISASATVLCKTPGTGSPTGTTCPEGWAYPAGTKLHAVSEGSVVLDNSLLNITCEGSAFESETGNEGGAMETVTGPEGTLTFAKCNCEFKTLKAGTSEIHWIEGTHNGTITAKGVEVTTSCKTIFGTVHCIYSVNGESIGDLTGGEPAIYHSNGAVIRTVPTSALCPNSGTFTATYKITTPTPLYVTGHT